jgi:hypothetical protein
MYNIYGHMSVRSASLPGVLPTLQRKSVLRHTSYGNFRAVLTALHPSNTGTGVYLSTPGRGLLHDLVATSRWQLPYCTLFMRQQGLLSNDPELLGGQVVDPAFEEWKQTHGRVYADYYGLQVCSIAGLHKNMTSPARTTTRAIPSYATPRNRHTRTREYTLIHVHRCIHHH